MEEPAPVPADSPYVSAGGNAPDQQTEGGRQGPHPREEEQTLRVVFDAGEGPPEERAEKVRRLREAIARGEYHPDPALIADRMLRRHGREGLT